ncbi:MAG: hypothetical protein JRH15_22560, partial [Deltaproteobacteria bacterium]|nr:hypothetical protein [Deltaproteobacteria bacterium]
GGAGTTATAAISGVPQIIVPHALDQHYWGNRIFSIGLGPKPIPRSRLTSTNLAAAIRTCLSTNDIKKNAHRVARQIRRGDSVSRAVREIERTKFVFSRRRTK